ncbi:hypothetical protein O3P69_017208 [Scylla paramamosain]|uniref:Uncharacterized protein n=1 Tax=Scylla paramamosain TaxID=85552 RepID=A0AAW0TW02_SCYPA
MWKSYSRLRNQLSEKFDAASAPYLPVPLDTVQARQRRSWQRRYEHYSSLPCSAWREATREVWRAAALRRGEGLKRRGVAASTAGQGGG